MNCPICGGQSPRLFEKDGTPISGCRRCGHRFAEYTPDPEHVQRVYADDYFSAGGAGYDDYLSEQNLLIAHGKRYGELLKNFREPGRLLDVGAAAGFILKGFQDSGWQGAGLEPNAGMRECAQAQWGLTIAGGSLEDLQADAQYDVVSMIQVLPHFYDLRRALGAAERATVPGGLWLIETWNRESTMARLLGTHWHEYSPPSVLHWFSPRDLRRLLEQFGMREIARGKPTKWLNAGHARSLLAHKLEGTRLGAPAERLLGLMPAQARIPYPGDDLFWTIYRKSRDEA